MKISRLDRVGIVFATLSSFRIFHPHLHIQLYEILSKCSKLWKKTKKLYRDSGAGLHFQAGHIQDL
jgi:hypothetical protein